jgi:flagellar biosynthetic protein FlhB
MMNWQAIMELGKGIAKMLAVGVTAYLILKSEWHIVPELMNRPLQATWAYWGSITKSLFWSVSMLLLVIGGFDYLFQFLSFERSLKMSKQEVKEEYKRREIDPQLKGRMRRMARDLINRKVLTKTKEATVILTNPTHYSVALRYEPGMPAPIVIAKGIDFLALQMREVAKEEKIPIIENRPLARELYATVKEGQEIPDKLYKVVAEIIRYVYRLKGRTITRKVN